MEVMEARAFSSIRDRTIGQQGEERAAAGQGPEIGLHMLYPPRPPRAITAAAPAMSEMDGLAEDARALEP